MSDILERLPPQSLEAERGVIGSLMLNSLLCDDVALIVRPEDFYSHANEMLYRRMMEMHNGGGKIDAMLLPEALRRAGELDAIGGVAYLVEVSQSVPVAAHAVHYAKIVQEKAMARALITASCDILRTAYDDTADTRGMLSRAEEKIFAVLEQRGSLDAAEIKDVLSAALMRIDERMKSGTDVGGISTGFVDLDAITGGLHKSELIILAARPSMGKTALASNIAENASIDRRVPTLFMSLEMSRLELADRMLCSYSKVNGHKIRNGTLDKSDRQQLVKKAADMSLAPLFVDDSPTRSMTEIAATARRLKRKKDLGLLIVDYLQLIEPDNQEETRQEQVAKIARRLKGLARELSIPILCLAQLNRQAETSKDNRPRLSHLRESGAIEQDADVVMFVHREEYYRGPAEIADKGLEGKADVILSKQRNGPTGEVKLLWQKDYTRFVNAVQEWNPDRSF